MSTVRWNRTHVFYVGLLALPALALAAETIDECESTAAWRPLSGRPTPRVESTSMGHDGGALSISFHESKDGPFVGRAVSGNEAWDRAAGLSFWFKGDGSEDYVAVTLLDESLTRRHAALISLGSKEWRHVQLRWDDFVPETYASDWLSDPDARMRPSDVRALWFGRWFYLRPWSSCSFGVDQIRIEAQLPVQVWPQAERHGLSRTLARLTARQDVTMVALGDSITDGYRLAKPEREAWPAQLQRLLRKRFDYVDIHVRNQGIGGLETRQAIALLPRDIGAKPPDLAIAHFGFNDLTAMEERRIPIESRSGIAARNLREMIRRIQWISRGRTEVLLVATVPGGDRARRNALDFFGHEAATAAREQGCAFTDAPRTVFREILERDGPPALFTQLPDGRQDVSHPHAEGQRIFAEALLEAFSAP